MKIRNGFVSNSSSSSFLVYGFKVYNGSDLYEKITHHYDNIWQYVRDLTDIDDCLLVGYTIASTEGVEDISVNLDNLETKKQEVVDILNSHDIDVSHEEFRTYLGETYD